MFMTRTRLCLNCCALKITASPSPCNSECVSTLLNQANIAGSRDQIGNTPTNHATIIAITALQSNRKDHSEISNPISGTNVILTATPSPHRTPAKIAPVGEIAALARPPPSNAGARTAISHTEIASNAASGVG